MISRSEGLRLTDSKIDRNRGSALRAICPSQVCIVYLQNTVGEIREQNCAMLYEWHENTPKQKRQPKHHEVSIVKTQQTTFAWSDS